MKRAIFFSLLGVSFLLTAFMSAGFAAEHPGKEHPGEAVEQGKIVITADTVKEAIRNYVSSQAQGGVFIVHDEKLDKDWRLKLIKIHDPVRMFKRNVQMVYFACSDFKSVDTDDVLDIDFWMVPEGDRLVLVDTKIHKLNGEPRFTYEGTEIKKVK